MLEEKLDLKVIRKITCISWKRLIQLFIQTEITEHNCIEARQSMGRICTVYVVKKNVGDIGLESNKNNNFYFMERFDTKRNQLGGPKNKFSSQLLAGSLNTSSLSLVGLLAFFFFDWLASLLACLSTQPVPTSIYSHLRISTPSQLTYETFRN